MSTLYLSSFFASSSCQWEQRWQIALASLKQSANGRSKHQAITGLFAKCISPPHHLLPTRWHGYPDHPWNQQAVPRNVYMYSINFINTEEINRACHRPFYHLHHHRHLHHLLQARACSLHPARLHWVTRCAKSDKLSSMGRDFLTSSSSSSSKTTATPAASSRPSLVRTVSSWLDIRNPTGNPNPSPNPSQTKCWLEEFHWICTHSSQLDGSSNRVPRVCSNPSKLDSIW